MSFQKQYLLFLFIFFLASCTHKEKIELLKPGSVIIRGKIDGVSETSVISLKSTNFLLNEEYLTQVVDSTGNFKFIVQLLTAQDILLEYNNAQARLLVTPGDSLTLSIDNHTQTSKNLLITKISGNNPQSSQNIQKYEQFKTTEPFIPQCENKSSEEYLKEISKHIQEEKSELNNFINQNKTSEDFVKWANHKIVYSHANYIMDYKFHHFSKGTKVKGDLFDKSIFPTNNHEAIISTMFGYHLWHYATDKYIQKDSLVLDLMGKNKLNKAYLRCIKNLQKQEEPGLCKDIMTYQILASLMTESFNDFVSVSEHFENLFTNPDLASLLDQKKKQNENQSKFHITNFDPELKEEKEIIGDFFANLSEKHKGKVIYLDIWAAWCGPCRSEIPNSIELQQNYKNKPVSFVNLCMSSDKDEWLKIINDANFSGDNYHFNKEQSELLREQLKWKGFPTYMLIDKNGTIIEQDAPRPSNKDEIKKKLDNLIVG